MINEVKAFAMSTKKFVVKNAPTILTGVGVAGSIGTLVYGCMLTPKAIKRIERAMDQKLKDKDGNYIATAEQYNNKLNPWEFAKAVVPVYWPVIITEGLTVTCIIMSNKISLGRIAAVSAAYGITVKDFDNYKNEVKNILGEKKAKDVQAKASQAKMMSNPVDNTRVIYTGKGDSLAYDCISGRYFYTNYEKVRQAVNNINEKLLYETNVPLNDLYADLGIPTVAIGDVLGWNGNGYGDKLDVNFTSQLTEDGTPCLVLDYQIAPGYTSEM